MHRAHLAAAQPHSRQVRAARQRARYQLQEVSEHVCRQSGPDLRRGHRCSTSSGTAPSQNLIATWRAGMLRAALRSRRRLPAAVLALLLARVACCAGPIEDVCLTCVRRNLPLVISE